MAIDTRNDQRLVELGLGAFEHLAAEGLMEMTGHVLRHLDVLKLVLADRHKIAAVDQDVGRHQHGIGEQPHGRAQTLCNLVLVGGGPLEEPFAGDGGQNPGQLGHLGHIGLAKEICLFGIEPECEVIEGDIQRERA